MREELIKLIKATQEAKVAALEQGLPATYKKQKALLEVLEQAYFISTTFDCEWEG